MGPEGVALHGKAGWAGCSSGDEPSLGFRVGRDLKRMGDQVLEDHF